MTKVYWTKLKINEWEIHMAATDKGLCYAGTPLETFDDLNRYITKWLPTFELIESEKEMGPYIEDLLSFFNGSSKQFTLPIDPYGTDFQKSVWQALTEIPYGQTVSYSDIANQIDKPSAVRAVGSAIGANPILIVVPCHRVIAKNGKLTGFRGGLEMKRQLLELESR